LKSQQNTHIETDRNKIIKTEMEQALNEDRTGVNTLIKANAKTLDKEMQWLSFVIETKIKLYLLQETEYKSIFELVPPDLSKDNSNYAMMVKQHNLKFSERVILALAIAPHVQPQLLDIFFGKNAMYDRNFTEFGGIKGHQHAGFLPTGETAAFILAADSLEDRFNVMEMFNEKHLFNKFNILTLVNLQTHELLLSGYLNLSNEYRNYLTTGESNKISL